MNKQGGLMNTELIKALKEDAEWAHANEWETPITLGDHLDDAADALESLTAQLAEKDAEIKRLNDEPPAYKFYYCESEDSYLLGYRVGNFYYAHWHDGIGFVFDMSRYLPWGEHVVAPHTAWKEHTYPSEPKEIDSSEWFKGFLAQQLSASQRMEKAAVEDIKYYLENNEENGVVYVPKFVVERIIKGRGPQEAGEGETARV